MNWTKFEICLAQCCQITQVKPEKTDAAALDSKAFRTEVVSSQCSDKIDNGPCTGLSDIHITLPLILQWAAFSCKNNKFLEAV